MPVEDSKNFWVCLYGFTTWGSIFNARQLVAIHSFLDCFQDLMRSSFQDGYEYSIAVACYLALWIDKIIVRMTSFTRWNNNGENFEQPFDIAKIAMMWDYAEMFPFNLVTGGGEGQLDWVLRVISRESRSKSAPATVFRGDASRLPLETGALSAIVTDPPYFDAIAYADLSDVCYIWLKRALVNILPDVFTTPTTPKSDEATALKHRHGGADEAEHHFTKKLTLCFREARRVCSSRGLVSVMFAHQSTKAWTALVNALFASGLNITATYPIDTERKARAVALGTSALESSITVVCRPRAATGLGSFKDVRRDIERVVKEGVHRFWGYGFRGADLIVACYGPAVGEFGRYELVERGDGTPVTVPELLQLVREAALRAIAGEFTGDQLSRLYFVWANLYGVAQQAWDDVRLLVQVGGEAENAMEVARGRGVFVVDGANSRLAVLADRAGRRNLGSERTDPLIDQLHRAMLLWKKEDRPGLVEYLHGHDLADYPGFWRLAQALFEVLPRDLEDWRLISALLGERNTLRTEIKRREAALSGSAEPSLFD
jgi:adenine-specific DNA methylase